MLEAPKHYECEEDELFRKDFDRILGDSLTDRLSDNMKVTNVDIAIPMNLKGMCFNCVTICEHFGSIISGLKSVLGIYENGRGTFLIF